MSSRDCFVLAISAGKIEFDSLYSISTKDYNSIRANQSRNTKMTDDSMKASYNAGQAKGIAQEKADRMIDNAKESMQEMSHHAGETKAQAQERASNMMQSMQETGQQMQAKAEGVSDAVREAMTN